MSAKFWLSKEAVPLTLDAVSSMSEDQARRFLAEMRWGNADEQTCPDCGVIDAHYDIRTRMQWRCKHCSHTFSVTTNTPFADHKLSYRKLAMAIFSFVINQKGLAALTLRRIIGGHYRTSFTLLHKIREAVMITVNTEKMNGVIEIDGGHFSGKTRKGRKKSKSTPADKSVVPKKYSNQHRTKISASAFPFHPNRRIVIVLREMFGEVGKGASRTVVAVCRSENTADIQALVQQWVSSNSTIHSDELPAYGNLKLMGYVHEAVNHSEEFSTDSGINQNQAESFFSRMRRACFGIYHRITPKYMLDYACEMAWREDVRRKNTKHQFASLFKRICSAGVSSDWVNYAHGHMRAKEIMFQAPLSISSP
jgi:transposase-like protein